MLAYTMPPEAEDVGVLREVFSCDIADGHLHHGWSCLGDRRGQN